MLKFNFIKEHTKNQQVSVYNYLYISSNINYFDYINSNYQ